MIFYRLKKAARRIVQHNKSVATICRTVRLYGEIDGEQRAAAFAYYALFSLFPLFALILTIGSALLSTADVVRFIQGFLPLDAHQQDLIWQTVSKLEKARGGISAISILILLWCSLHFFQALVRGINSAWHSEDIPWWQMPIRNLMMLTVITSALLIGILAPALLHGLRDLMLSAEQVIKPHLSSFDLHTIANILDLSRYGLATVVLFYTLSLLYMLAPRRRVQFSKIWAPALFATAMLQLCQNIFVNYLPRFVHYNAVYGTVGGLMLLLLWVYVSGIIIIFCGCLCAALDESNERED